MDRRWRIASENEILEGLTTDIYFQRAADVLEAENHNPIVYAEITVSGMPDDLEWGIVAGIDDALKLFEGRNVNIYGLKEGDLFYPRTSCGVKIPVLAIEGPYLEFAILETPLLGFLCHTSGMVTKTAHIRKACGDKSLLSFGARRTHPAITPQVEYAAYVGGCDGVSCVLGARMLEMEPSGTMPHALIIAFQDHVRAWQSYDKHLPSEVPRIVLTDTYLDEVTEAIMAAESVSNLVGVRLDTSSSRRGNFKRIIQEVRWELDARGFENIQIFVSGGLTVQKILELEDAPVDGFGVGGAISNSPAIDFAMDLVAIEENGEWKPCAKRGKFSGRKEVWRCDDCLQIDVTIKSSNVLECPRCKKKMQRVMFQLMKDGNILQSPKTPKEIRENILRQIKKVN